MNAHDVIYVISEQFKSERIAAKHWHGVSWNASRMSESKLKKVGHRKTLSKWMITILLWLSFFLFLSWQLVAADRARVVLSEPFV